MKIEIVNTRNKAIVRDLQYGDVVKMQQHICLVCYSESTGSKKGLVSLYNPADTWSSDSCDVEYLGKLKVSQ